MALLTHVPPAVEPVALEELKDFLRIDANDSSQDGLISALGLAARQWAEDYTQKRFITQTIRLMIDFFPGYVDLRLVGSKISSPFVSGANALMAGLRYAIALPCPPVQSISAFTYLDSNGNSTPMTLGVDYLADLFAQPARLTPPFGSMWPVTLLVPNALTIDYVVGFGDTPASVPEGIKTAIKLLVSYWFENRIPDQNNIPQAAKALLFPHRDLRL